jgi:Fe-S-cluster containining protein
VEIIIDLKHIEEMAKEKEEENWAFRSFLKQHDMAGKELDALVHQITDEISSQIDCTKCANCCKQIRPVLDQDDISEFASGLKMAEPEFQEIYLSPHEEISAKQVFNGLPCPFLTDNRCSNYACRPKDCRSYPHLHKEGFVTRLWGVVENYAICPIVFNVYEQLKAELWYSDGLDDDDLLDYP